MGGGGFSKAVTKSLFTAKSNGKDPGPGSYNYKSTLSDKGGKLSYLSRSIAFSESAVDEVVGPGVYDVAGDTFKASEYGAWRPAERTVESFHKDPPPTPGE